MAFLILAIAVAVLFVVGVLCTNPEGRNPHVDHRRNRKWNTRNPK